VFSCRNDSRDTTTRPSIRRSFLSTTRPSNTCTCALKSSGVVSYLGCTLARLDHLGCSSMETSGGRRAAARCNNILNAYVFHWLKTPCVVTARTSPLSYCLLDRVASLDCTVFSLIPAGARGRAVSYLLVRCYGNQDIYKCDSIFLVTIMTHLTFSFEYPTQTF
jgi:hypothetical protein